MNLLLGVLLSLAVPDDGWSRLKMGDEVIDVYRDAWGIPHVFARTVRGAFWAEGYTEAEDRMEQMELFRRAAKGQGAAFRGKAALASDRDVALRGYTEAELQGMFDSSGARPRMIVSAYADGVNAWLKAGKDLPPLYAQLGVKPRPWSATDCVAIGVLMARRFGSAGDLELTGRRVYDELVKKVGEENAKKIVRDLLKENDPSAPTTLNDHLRTKPRPRREFGFRAAPGMSEGAFAAYRADLDAARLSRRLLGVPTYFGSNAWVVSPRKSATGNAMLYGGPMMGFRGPSICNEIHLVAPGLETAGMSFPGVPGVMIGWNRDLAWTTTSGGADLVDVYTLELNPDNPEEYRYRGGWKAFDVIERTLEVRGAEPERLKVYRSVYGPLVGPRDTRNHRAHTLKMSFWLQEHRTMEGVFDMNFARTAAEFEAAAHKVVTSHNFFCATKDGRIGFWYCGAHPVRKKGHAPHLPQDGGGDMEWEGILPVGKWPHEVDPVDGFFGNWNNKPARSWPSVGFGKIFWGKKILEVLESEEKVSFERFTSIAQETAYHNYLADYFAPIILRAAKGSTDADVRRGVEILKGWDHMERDGEPGPRIMEIWVRAASRRMFGKIVNPLMLANREVQRYVVDPLLYALEGDRCIVPLHYDYAAGRDLDALVVDALRETMRLGDKVLTWKEPEVDFRGEIGRVKSKRGRGTYQVAVEMTPEGPRAVTLAAPGQSGRPGSAHSRDQVELFEKWEVKPFVFKRSEMK